MLDTVPAHFVEKHRNQTARLGSNASLRCEAKGDHPLKIVWKKAGSQLDPKLPDYRYTLKEDNTTDGAVSVLGFVSTSREDSGRYFCIASNAYGRDEMTIHLYIQGTFINYYLDYETIEALWKIIGTEYKDTLIDNITWKIVLIYRRTYNNIAARKKLQ